MRDKNIIKTIFIICLMSLFNVLSYTDTNSMFFDRISIEQGLSNVAIMRILQDKQGFMWFGTKNGLNKYDGYNFTVYRHNSNDNTSLTKNFITSLCEDEDGILWIGTDGGGLNRFDKKSEKFLSYRHQKNNPDSLSNDFISSLADDKNGILWIGTFSKGLNKFDKKSGKNKHYLHQSDNSNSISSNEIYDIYKGRDHIWIGTRRGLNKFDKKNEIFTLYDNQTRNPKNLDNSIIEMVFEDNKGILWLGTKRGGLIKFNHSTKIFNNYQAYLNKPDSLSNNRVNEIFEDRDGILWIGTDGGGLNKFNRKTGIFIKYNNQLDDPNSLSDNSIISIFEDKGGNLWIGTRNGGLSKFDKKRGEFFNYKQQSNNYESLKGKSVMSFYKDINEHLWIGTNDGLNKTNLNLETFTNYKFQPDNRNNNSIYSVIENKKDNMLVGAINGLYKFDLKKEVFTKFQFQFNLPDRRITQIYKDKQDMLWIGTDGDGLYKSNHNSNKFTRYFPRLENSQSLSGIYIWSVFEDSENNIWIGTIGGGLNKFNRNNETFISYQHQANNPQSISSNQVITIYEDIKKILWIGTDNGLNKFDRQKKSFHYFENREVKFNEAIKGILEDKKGNLWISTNNGINKFNPETGLFINYDKQDGLQGNEFNDGSCFKDSFGRLYFGGINGFTVFEPDKIIDNTYIPPVVITDFLIFNKSVKVARAGFRSDNFQLQNHINFTNEIILNYTDYIFAFEFSALNYRQQKKNKYKYKLEGLDNNWIETDYKNRRATYTNLSPGEYIFRVKGSNDDGYWNEKGASIKVVILPPFWKTIWFKTIIILLIFSLLFILYNIRIKKIKRKLKFDVEVKNICSKKKLTNTETEILLLILKGKTNKEIEDIQFISSGSIRNSISRIYKKMDTDNRLSLIKMFKDL